MTQTELELEGMSCASCAAAVERALNRVDGVDATVNFATERAAVVFDPERASVGELVGAVESIGYGARERTPLATTPPDRLGPLRRRLTAAVVLSVPLAVLAVIPAARFDGWEWVALALSTPVVFWAGAEFHRAALASARHRAATMDTLVSLGTLSAWTWSVVVLVGGIGTDTYFEVAAVITTLVLLGRYLELRAKRRSGDATGGLPEDGGKEARVPGGAGELLVPADRLVAGDRFVVRPGEKIAADGVVEEGDSAIDRSLLTGEPVPVEVSAGSEV